MRTLTVKTGTYGCRHDPYSFTERTVTLDDGTTVTLHDGIATDLRINGERTAMDTATKGDQPHCAKFFHRLTGITVAQFDKHHARLHPYYDDPMGHPSQFI